MRLNTFKSFSYSKCIIYFLIYIRIFFIPNRSLGSKLYFNSFAKYSNIFFYNLKTFLLFYILPLTIIILYSLTLDMRQKNSLLNNISIYQ